MAHFWLHQIGTLILLVALFLMTSGTVAADSIGFIFSVSKILVLPGVLVRANNVIGNTR